MLTLFSAVAWSVNSDESTDQRFPISITDQRVDTGGVMYAANYASCRCHGEPDVTRPTLGYRPNA
jgi:hypothetical protein